MGYIDTASHEGLWPAPGTLHEGLCCATEKPFLT